MRTELEIDREGARSSLDWISLEKQLTVRDPLERAAAEQAVRGGGAGSIEHLVAIVRRENGKKPVRFVLALSGLVLGLVAIASALSVVFHVELGGAVGGLAAAMLALASAFAPTRLQKRAMCLLTEADDVRTIGPLLEALDKQDSATMKAAATALIRLLPHVRDVPASLLNDDQRALLLKAATGSIQHLGQDTAKGLAIVSLQALRHVGDPNAVPAIRRLAEGKGFARKNAEVQRAAMELLPALDQLAEKARVRQTLLRPAADGDDSDLLRAVTPASEADAEGLVRPAQQPDK